MRVSTLAAIYIEGHTVVHLGEGVLMRGLQDPSYLPGGIKRRCKVHVAL
jgi:hypothetical protein